MHTALTVLELLLSLLLIGVVVLQSGKSAGLSGSIAGGAEVLFGGKKKGLDELLSKITWVLLAAFLVVALLMSLLL
ncbi:MAG: preprotein translocase subunit SecG [Clostridia bacterium]|nr:MAG: preprotein translocase subunit SecG [Clostridia bacterium]